MGVRKNQASLTTEEKAAFIAAVKAMKANGIYDIFVEHHRDAFSKSVNPAHRGPAFLPWHRKFLLFFEKELQKINPNVTVPYWDFIIDRYPTSSIWNPDFLGGDGDRQRGGEVTTGHFAFSTGNWTLTVIDQDEHDPFLKRAFGVMDHIPSKSDVENTLRVTPYDSAPWRLRANGFRDSMEAAIHDHVHMWIGGSGMAASSPNDPAFWLLHCNIDRLWVQWQEKNGIGNYLPNRSNVPDAPQGHALNDPMWPWENDQNPPTPESVLDHKALGYTYDTELEH